MHASIDKRLEIKIETHETIPDKYKEYRSSFGLGPNREFQFKNSWISVSFLDSGEGISKDLYDKVYTPFFTTKSQGEGIGLGLFVIKKILHDNGGILFFKSEKCNTEFSVFIPE